MRANVAPVVTVREPFGSACGRDFLEEVRSDQRLAIGHDRFVADAFVFHGYSRRIGQAPITKLMLQAGIRNLSALPCWIRTTHNPYTPTPIPATSWRLPRIAVASEAAPVHGKKVKRKIS